MRETKVLREKKKKEHSIKSSSEGACCLPGISCKCGLSAAAWGGQRCTAGAQDPRVRRPQRRRAGKQLLLLLGVFKSPGVDNLRLGVFN